jgi:putative transposase
MTKPLWNLPAPPSFRGFDEEMAIQEYERDLVHWRQDGATYFVTFRLADALPIAKQRELARIRKEWLARNQDAGRRRNFDELAKVIFTRTEAVMDMGFGSCWLKLSQCSDVIANAMRYFDGERYELVAYIVMPNHVHLLVRPLIPQSYSLECILHSWKSYSAKLINKVVGRSGALWQRESYDRIIRDEEHLYRVIQYIGRNSRVAGLIGCARWINPSWVKLGWIFQDNFE